MNKEDFVAMMVFAIGRDMLDMPAVKVINLFKDYIQKIKDNTGMGHREAIGVVIWDAQQDIKLGYSYGVYDKYIMG